MNNGQQGTQSAQGQAAAQGQQQRPKQLHMFRPEQMRQLPDVFPAEDKLKWEQGLTQLWSTISKNDAQSQAHIDAKRKLFDFSRTLGVKLQTHRASQQQALQAQTQASTTQQAASQANQSGQQGQQGQSGQQQSPASQTGSQATVGPQPTPNQPTSAARPPSQGQTEQSSTQAQAGTMNNGSMNQAGNQQPRPQPKISPKLLEHVNNFPFVIPQGFTTGTPAAEAWVKDQKSKYLKALVSMEGGASRVQTIDAITKSRLAEGNPLTADEEKDFKAKKEAAQAGYNEAKRYVDSFRNAQNVARTAQAGANQGTSQNTTLTNSAPANGGPAPVRPQMSVQQNPNPALQNTQAITDAIAAAKNQQNQQMSNNRPPMGSQPMSMSQAPQMPSQNAPSQQMNMAQQQGQPPNLKTEPGLPPQINTAITQMQNQGRPMQNSPQSAAPRSGGMPPQSATSQQPQALSHQDALHQAARSYSNNVPTSTVMGQGHTHPSQQMPREPNVMTNKMPIPKHLPERATAPPQPAQMPQSRPTYSGGPSNAGNGVLGQPVLTKIPPFSMEGEENRVLSKKKLDELVRQVTGGGGLDGESLAPDVEEVSLLLLLWGNFMVCKEALLPLFTCASTASSGGRIEILQHAWEILPSTLLT